MGVSWEYRWAIQTDNLWGTKPVDYADEIIAPPGANFQAKRCLKMIQPSLQVLAALSELESW